MKIYIKVKSKKLYNKRGMGSCSIRKPRNTEKAQGKRSHLRWIRISISRLLTDLDDAEISKRFE